MRKATLIRLIKDLFASFCTVMAAIFLMLIIEGLYVKYIHLRSKNDPTRKYHSQLSKDLSNAKLIYLGMKMYAGDHNGEFPSKTEDGKPITTVNEAFRILVPNYIPAKQIFYSPHSKWTPNPPSPELTPGQTPRAGENHFAYISNLTDADNPKLPFIATGFSKNTIGIYSMDNQPPKSTTGMFGVVVVRLDGSGRVERGSTSDFRIYEKFGQSENRDIFKPAPGWLRADQAPLNPEG